ncbi:hypothetical protein AAHC03_020721 [Spirometra sp. Aus1]
MCSMPVGDHFHHFQSLFKGKLASKVDEFLESKTQHIDFTEFYKSKVLTESCPVRRVHVAQLAANNPLEDRWNLGFVQVDETISSFVCSVLDGHSGSACSHALAWVALDYMAAAFLDEERLKTVLQLLPKNLTDQPYHPVHRLCTTDSAGHTAYAALPPPPDVKLHFRQKLRRFVRDLLSRRERNTEPAFCLTEALSRIDNDICCLGMEDLDAFISQPTNPFSSKVSQDLLQLAMSGSVGLFGHLCWSDSKGGCKGELHSTSASQLSPGGKPQPELQIANVGDCAALLVSEDESAGLKSTPLTTAHAGATNPDEVARLLAQHPEDTRKQVLRNGGRLLGELAPSRAFGDVRYKWPAKRLVQLARYFGAEQATCSESIVPMGPWAGLPALPSPYSSPPYLTAKPDVKTVRLKPSDRYLVMATDGLWDVVTPESAAATLSSLQKGQCPASRLLRTALSFLGPHMAASQLLRRGRSQRGQGPAGLNAEDSECSKMVAALLALPPGLARYYRDDITVVVVELQVPET